MGTSSDVTVIEIRKFLRVTVEGQLDLLASREALLQLSQAATPGSDASMLIDVREAPSNMTPTELAAVAREFVELQLGVGAKVAMLTDPARIENARFLATSAKNMGVDVLAFDNYDDACEWLMS